MREVTVAPWLDLRNKKNYVRLNIKELKDKQKVTADGELFIPIGADSDLWALLEQQKYSGDAALYFTVCDIVTDCQNKLDIVYNEVGQRNKHIYRKETDRTYTYIPFQTQVTGYFAEADGSILKRVTKYGEQIFVIIHISLSKTDKFDKNEFLFNLIENITGKKDKKYPDKKITQITADGQVKLNFSINDKQNHTKLPYQPRLFYFDCLRDDKKRINNIHTYTYPENYGKDKNNDAYLNIDIQKQTTAEDEKKQEEQDKQKEQDKTHQKALLLGTTTTVSWSVISVAKKAVSLKPIDYEDKAKKKNKEIDKKNKDAFPNIESTLGRNYSLQLKVAKDTGINQSLEKISPVIIGEGKISKKNGKCECRDLIWGNKLSCDERKKVIEVCSNIWGEDQKKEKANMLMAVMHLETMATFNPSIENGKGYVGLVQFHSSTAEGLGTTYDALKKMTFIEQMIYVEKYLKQNKDKMNTLVDFYLQVVKPNAVGNGNNPNYIVFDESIEVPDGDGSKTSSEQRKKNITREPWVTKYGYASNPPFMKEEGEYTKRRKWVYTRQQYEERYGFHNGKTYIWEIEKEINQKHYQAGIAQKYTGQCANESEKEIEIGDRAPWMDIVISEAINYGGIKPAKSVKVQKRIEKYHSESCNTNYGYKIAWCASFASWCLKEANYPSPSTAGSLLFTTSTALEKCDLFYGGIVVFEDCDINGKKIKKPKKNKDGTQGWEQHGGGHISFIYGKITENEYAVLGGNQGNMIKVSKYDLSGNIFFSFEKTYKLVNGSSKVIQFYKRLKGCYKPKGYTIKDCDYLTNNDAYKNIDEANQKLKLNGESTKKAGENSQN